MKTSEQWFQYFETNLTKQRIDWEQLPTISAAEIAVILPSLQAWQLGETSDGSNLIKASERYAAKYGDYRYVDCIKLFIKEEQKHGNNLGKYIDYIQQPRIQYNWGDTLFRKIRHWNSNMEIWTLAVITVESTAQLFYQSLKDATGCLLLKTICTDILIDEAAHIQFQMERLATIFSKKNSWQRLLTYYAYKTFYFATSLVVWNAHKKVFKAGGHNFSSYIKAMRYKFKRNIAHLRKAIYEAKATHPPLIALK